MKMTFKAMKFLLLTLFIATTLQDSTPQNGVVVENLGNLFYKEGVLMIPTNLNVLSTLETNMQAIQYQMANSIKIFTTAVSNNGKLNGPQFERIKHELQNNVLIFGEILHHLDKTFVNETMHISNITSYVNNLLHYYSSIPSKLTSTDPIYKHIFVPQTNTTNISLYIMDSNSFVQEPITQPFAAGSFTYPKKKQQIRRKRGFVNGLGLGLRLAFGVATVDQIQILEGDFENVKISTNSLILETDKIKHSLEHSLNYIKTAMQEINYIKTRLTNQDFYLTLLHVLQSMSSTLKMLLNLAIESENRIALLTNNLIQPELTQKQLRRIIKEGESLFNLKFPFDTTDLMDYSNYRYKKLFRTYATTDQHTFVLAVPFVALDSPYSLYALHAFPTRNGDGTYITPLVKKYIAQSQHDFTLMNSLESCQQIDHTYLCNNKVQKFSRSNSCEAALVNNIKEDINRHCTYVPVLLPKQYYALRVRNYWLIYFSEKVTGSVICPNKRRNKIQTFQNLTKLVAPCELRTSHVTFTTTQTRKFNISQEAAFRIPMSTLEISIEENTKSNVQILKNIDEELATVAKLPTISLLNSHWTVMGPVVGFGSISTLLFIGVIVYLVYYFYGKRKNLNRGGQLQQVIAQQDVALSLKVYSLEKAIQDMQSTRTAYPQLE